MRFKRSAAVIIAALALVGMGLTARPAHAASIGLAYRLYAVSAGVNGDCANNFADPKGTVSLSPYRIWASGWTDLEGDGDFYTLTGYENGFSSAYKYYECDASTAQTYEWVYYGDHMVNRKMLETLECMGATCDPIAGPTYFGWQNGWASI
jgi:hypothetical protein